MGLKIKLSGWQSVAIMLAFLVLVPLAVLFSSFFLPSDGVWRHLIDTVLMELLFNTFWLVAGVGIGTTLLGVSLAWLTGVCDFPGRKLFDWALLLPLSIPPYVMAFVSIGLLDFTGPIQTQLRAWFGPIWFPKIRSVGGVILVMTLALYPYVYAIARNAFISQGRNTLEVAQSLGHSRFGGFFRATLPIARPAVIAGLMLALMEAIADFGAVSIFNYDTFTTAIYKAWFGFYSLAAAAQLSSFLVLIVFAMLLLAQRFRPPYMSPRKNVVHGERIKLLGVFRLLAFAYAAMVFAVAFVVPVSQLSLWAINHAPRDFDRRFIEIFGRSLFLGGVSALLVSASALFLAYARRLKGDRITRVAVRLSTLGYALPGSVLAVGIFIPLVWLDRKIIGWGAGLFHLPLGFFLTGTLAAMLLGYLIRFLAVAHGSLDSEMRQIPNSMDEAARSLGLTGKARLKKVYFPMLRGGLLTAATLVFVDVMKEMPITLMTRPFGWDTLSVRIFEMTSEGEWERAALPAIALIVAGLVPVLLLTRLHFRLGPYGRPGKERSWIG